MIAGRLAAQSRLANKFFFLAGEDVESQDKARAIGYPHIFAHVYIGSLGLGAVLGKLMQGEAL